MNRTPTASRSDPTPRADLLLLTLITALAIVLRCWHLTARSFSLDEGFSAFLARTAAADFTTYVWRSELNMGLYYALLRCWANLGSSELALRSLSVVFAAATLPVIYLLGRRLFGRSPALIAALLLAVHPFHVMLAQQARSYSLLILLISLSSLFFLRSLQQPSWPNGIAYALLSAAAVYSHFFAALVILAQWLSLFLLPRRPVPWKRLVAFGILLLALLAPAGIFLLHADRANVAWVPRLTLQQVLDALYSLTLPKARCLAYVALWAAGIWQAFRLRDAEGWPYRFVAAWLLMPLAITLAASFFQPLLLPRYLAACVPAAVLLAAAGWAQIARWSRPVAAVVVLIIVLYSASAVRFFLRHPDFEPDWRSASRYVLSHAQPGDEVILDRYVEFTFDYYRSMSAGSTPKLVVAESASSPLPTPAPGNVWVVGPVIASGPNFELSDQNFQAQAFESAHKPTYCAVPPHPDSGIVRVWQFQRCGD